MAAIAITRTEHTSETLREEAARCKNARLTRRLLAVALVLDGHSRTKAAEVCAMDRQTLCDWVHRYNQDGIAGLTDRSKP